MEVFANITRAAPGISKVVNTNDLILGVIFLFLDIFNTVETKIYSPKYLETSSSQRRRTWTYMGITNHALGPSSKYQQRVSEHSNLT